MGNQVKSFNDVPPYLFYNKKDSNNENDEAAYVPIIFKSDEPNFVGMYAMSYKNGIINPDKFLFKVEGDTYEEVAHKLASAFGKLPVSNRIEGVFWKNKKGAPKQVGFDMG